MKNGGIEEIFKYKVYLFIFDNFLKINLLSIYNKYTFNFPFFFLFIIFIKNYLFFFKDAFLLKKWILFKNKIFLKVIINTVKYEKV